MADMVNMLDIKGLRVKFISTGKEAVHGIDLSMEPGERLGLVGESGSGKTVTAMAISGLIERYNVEMEGEILFDGKDLRLCSRDELREIQGKDIGVVFQEPMTSLNPLIKVGHQIEETLKLHTDKSKEEIKAIALDAMEKVGLPNPEETYEKYPHQLSGGQRQRAMIASAMVIHPKLSSALDPKTADSILKLLKDVSEEYGIAILLISHDLRVIRHLCDHVAVMYSGDIVERGETEEVFSNPQHQYTKQLIKAIPAREKVQRSKVKEKTEREKTPVGKSLDDVAKIIGEAALKGTSKE